MLFLLLITALTAPTSHQMQTLSKGHQKKLRKAIAQAEAVLMDESCQLALDALMPPERVSPWVVFYEELRDKGVCKKVDARATPKGDRVWLCKTFWRLGEEGRAAVLIHEWSHLGGTLGDHNQINPIIYQLRIERNCIGRRRQKGWLLPLLLAF